MKRAPFKRRKKGEITKLKEELWGLCRQISARTQPHQCYTCGTSLRWGSSVMQLGHFIARSFASQELVFDLKNLRWQCRICNQFRNGEWPTFEANLIRDHGQAYVDELKERNRITRGTTYPKDWYLAKIAEYTALLSTLQGGQTGENPHT
jgi:hypothetical protein